MPDEQAQKIRDKIDRTNLAATIIGPILVSGIILWVGWSVRSYFTIELATQARYNAATYVGIQAFDRAHDETTKQIDTIGTDVASLKTGVAVINSKLDSVVKNKP